MTDIKDCPCACSIDPAKAGRMSGTPTRYFEFRSPGSLYYCGAEAYAALQHTNWNSFKAEAETAGATVCYDGSKSGDDACYGCWHWEPDNAAAEELFERIGRALSDYPCLDEWAYGALESDAWWAYWNDYGMTDFCATRLELSTWEWSDVEELLGQDLVDDLSEKIVEGMNHYDGWTTTFDVYGAGEAFDLWVEGMTVLRTFVGAQGVDA